MTPSQSSRGCESCGLQPETHPNPECRRWVSRAEGLFERNADVHRCVDCGDPTNQYIGSYWLAPDALWAKVVGDNTVVLCPVCFYERADMEDVHVSWRAVCDD